MTTKKLIRTAFEQGQGIFRLIPNFIPRTFARPGRRLRLHPHDYFALGTRRGAIKERWFSSVTTAMNGELAPSDEGLSYVSTSNDPEDRFLFKDAVEELGAELIGGSIYGKYGTWPMFSKFFDFETPLFHHLHPSDEKMLPLGLKGKPEAYYFPPQLNNHPGDFPVTYFGFDPDVTIDQVRERLLAFEEGDNRITELSRAYRIELGTGWYTPPGVLHAPGSYLTYEPQWNSDVYSVHENIVGGEVYGHEFLSASNPDDKKFNLEYTMQLMDWEKNVDPHYKKNYFRPPIVSPQSDERHTDKWITYGNEYFSAKELTIHPGQTVTIYDQAAYGCIIIQGHGAFGNFDAEAAIMLRYGQLSADEYFVSEQSAKAGVNITNRSLFEPMVILKHFGPNHPNAPAAPNAD